MKETELKLINRTRPVFEVDWEINVEEISRKVRGARILVVGGAGSIGGSVTEILFRMGPEALHVVDINENASADLVRRIRSSMGYRTKDFQAICFDPLSDGADAFLERNGLYDAILNFAAVKHVRSEKDCFTLSRMFDTNVRLMKKLVDWSVVSRAQVLFSVSTDKAANPANLMGASKRLMEMIGFALAPGLFSSARFANVAFSNGSLLNAFWDRLELNQPFSAPSNIRRFFITHDEAAKLCLLGAFAAPKGTVVIPRVPGEIELTSFVDVATNVLRSRGLEPQVYTTEEGARSAKLSDGNWPCFFFESDTTGEKPYEEFVADGEDFVESTFEEIGVIGKLVGISPALVDEVLAIDPIGMAKDRIVDLVGEAIPGFAHAERGKNLDQRM